MKLLGKAAHGTAVPAPNSAGGGAVQARGAYEVDDHMVTPEEVAERYNVAVDWKNIGGSKGLTTQQVKELQAKHGLNQLTPPKSTPEIIKFLLQFTNPLMALLLVAGALTFMAYGIQSPRDKNNAILAAALIIVVTLTCIMSYMQERSASNLMDSLKKMMPNKCTVVRDGQEQKVDALELVPGDLVRLYIGDRVPADIRIIETFELKVECSSLTGESELVPASIDRKHDLPAEARNLVFMSSLAMNGEGRGIVIRTGDETMIGKIATLASDTNTHRSTLQVEVHRLVWFVGVLAFTVAIILFVVGLARKMSPLPAFVNGFILVVVANVPEGLPATVTSLLSLTALRLRDRNVLIKRTDIIENLGVATIIASDKTGTLTQNKMSVENIFCNMELHGGKGFQPPPAAPQASLERASRLAKASLMRRSQLGRTSNLGRATSTSGAVGRISSLGRVSHDPATQMAVGRTARPRGDGSLEFTAPSNLGKASMSLQAVQEVTVNSFSVQSFGELSAVTWERSSALTKLLTIATVCNKAKFTFGEEQQSGKDGKPEHVAITVPMFQPGAEDTRRLLGDATDCGLLRYCDRLVPSSLVRMAYKKVFDIPFNSANKWSLAVTTCPGDSNYQLVMMKGAPEIVLTKCSHHLYNKQEKEIDDDFRAAMNAAYERCGFMGERVIGFCYKKIAARSVDSFHEEGQGPPTEGLVFMGLMSLVDPPRPGVLEAVNKCRSAGIRVAMVTGDHPLTAEAIARKVGIVTLMTVREVAAEAGVPEADIGIADERVGAAVVTGSQLRDITTEDDWDDILTKPEIVFARTSPQQKLQIVENLQRLGETVAVTGDGVNDSPALKRAQIGVAMGKGGSDVARDAADIEGRVIYDNLKKTIAYTLAHAVPEVLPLFLNLVLNFPLGLGGLLILSIDLLTEQGPAISLAYEPAEARVMERPPRDNKRDRLVDGSVLRYAYLVYGIITSALCMLAFFTVFWWNGVPLSSVYNQGSDYWMFPETQGDLTLTGTCKLVGGAEVCRVLSARDQAVIYWQAQSAWYVTLICSQFWHIWICKTRQESIFKHGLFRNTVTVYGTAVSVAVMIIIVYAPFLQGIFGTWYLPGIGWVPMIGTLLWLLPYSEYTKRQVRTNPDGWWARKMAW
ncbi:hypothetical protein COO60DRAFT_1698701 [Scenedesmus sp. NREL 46B-D3]|nr:hypothetical protein COO60DRAFT_1698701 [Scenedesmus sp. NREL 46B-D3]